MALAFSGAAAAAGVYLPIEGVLEPALLPFLLAGALYAAGDTVATFIESRDDGIRWLQPRSHPLRR